MFCRSDKRYTIVFELAEAKQKRPNALSCSLCAKSVPMWCSHDESYNGDLVILLDLARDNGGCFGRHCVEVGN